MGSACSSGALVPTMGASPDEGPTWGATVARWSTATDRGSQVAEMPTLTMDADTASRGPSNWSKIFPKAAGEKQSPIDIVQKNVQSDPFLAENPLRWNYKGLRCTNLLNTGCGWRADVTASGPIVISSPVFVFVADISGGPLHHNYQMVQFHSHWGTCSKMGSEHTVDGEHYAGELHLVHYNLDMYSRASEAACSDKGLSVIGVFLKEGKPHEELQKITDSMKNVVYKGNKCSIDQDIDIGSLIPSKQNSSYWTYEGSLTTPPCYESVTWIVFKEPIEVSQEQV
ncbi:unnamed protein product, partial [Ixodes hexagonus]